jgi:hypothetical protein
MPFRPPALLMLRETSRRFYTTSNIGLFKEFISKYSMNHTKPTKTVTRFAYVGERAIQDRTHRNCWRSATTGERFISIQRTCKRAQNNKYQQVESLFANNKEYYRR